MFEEFLADKDISPVTPILVHIFHFVEIKESYPLDCRNFSQQRINYNGIE